MNNMCSSSYERLVEGCKFILTDHKALLDFHYNIADKVTFIPFFNKPKKKYRRMLRNHGIAR